MVMLLERTKLVVEGAGAVAVAALMQGRVARARRRRRSAPCCQGATSTRRCCPSASGWARPPPAGGWCCRRSCRTAPGALSGLLQVVAEHGGNVVDVEHLRDGIDLHVRRDRHQPRAPDARAGGQPGDPRRGQGAGLRRARRAPGLALRRQAPGPPGAGQLVDLRELVLAQLGCRPPARCPRRARGGARRRSPRARPAAPAPRPPPAAGSVWPRCSANSRQPLDGLQVALQRLALEGLVAAAPVVVGQRGGVEVGRSAGRARAGRRRACRCPARGTRAARPSSMARLNRL